MTAVRPKVVAAALALDAALVVAFAATGRASHEEQILEGLWRTAWPFLTGLALGWLISLGWRAPLKPLRACIPIWLVTLIGGMLLRALSGQGTSLPFVIVATLVLFTALVGWRALAAWITRRRAR